jgi:hypothetical protein
MGQRFHFRCASCAYEAEVSGGPDCGMAAATQTVACSKCKKLWDVVTSHEPWNYGVVTIPMKCPKSRASAHKVTAWNRGDPCPQCGGVMRARRDPVLLWD